MMGLEAYGPEVEELLRQDGGLQAMTVWRELKERHPGKFHQGQLRTLQRRFNTWRKFGAGPRSVPSPGSCAR